MTDQDAVRASLTVGTAGHIDHGKTALVRALTGKDTDRLTEERRRGMSIELGYAELEAGGRRLSLVDVPGHERFVRTMIAGASGIDLFLLVVAADDGVMPQTREHLAVLRALGVRDGVVALTKVDLVDAPRPEAVEREIAELVPGVEVVRASSRTGEGIDALRSSLGQAAERVDSRRAREGEEDGGGEVALHVDRVFTVAGHGTVVTGTLWSGRIARGDRVVVLPGGREARVRSIESHDLSYEIVGPRRRVALNLAGLGRDEVERGDVVTLPGSDLRPTYRLDVQLDDRRGTVPESDREHRRLGGDPADGAAASPGADFSTRRHDGEIAGENGQAPDRDPLAHRAGAEPTAGSGRVLSERRVQVHHGTRESPARVVDLGDGAAQLRLEQPLLARRGDRVVIRRIAPPDTLGGAVVIDSSPRRRSDPSRISVSISRCSATESRRASRPGSASGPAAPAKEERRPSEPSELARRVLAELEGDGERPRTPARLAEDLALERREVERAIGELVDAGEAVRMKADVVYPTATAARLSEAAAALAVAHGSTSIGETRDALGLSRKYAQALLEHLDGERVLRRDGDRHVPRGAGN